MPLNLPMHKKIVLTAAIISLSVNGIPYDYCVGGSGYGMPLSVVFPKHGDETLPVFALTNLGLKNSIHAFSPLHAVINYLIVLTLVYGLVYPMVFLYQKYKKRSKST